MTINGAYYGDHNVYEDESGTVVFHLNRMLGSAEKAITLTSVLPNDLTGKTIEVIATDSVGATPSFINEFLGQLIARRNVSKVVFVGANGQIQSGVTSFAVLYEVHRQISFVN
jgi:hypothetical protein